MNEHKPKDVLFLELDKVWRGLEAVVAGGPVYLHQLNQSLTAAQNALHEAYPSAIHPTFVGRFDVAFDRLRQDLADIQDAVHADSVMHQCERLIRELRKGF